MSDKTEAPTPRRMEEAREEGQVARSLEFNSAAILLIGALLLTGPGKNLVLALQDEMVSFFGTLNTVDVTERWVTEMFLREVVRVMPSMAIIILGILATGVVVTLVQTGFLWTSKKIGFDFKRLNPISNLQRLFSGRGLVELAKNLLKLLVVGWVAYGFLRERAQEVLDLSKMDFYMGVTEFVSLASALMVRIAGVYIIIAIADYAYQRWTFMRQMRMSKQEIKEDLKRSEGDPFLRSRIRSQQRRIARSRMMANVKKSTVVVTNPTHLALALEYQSGMNAPKLLAKGAYRVAEKIIAIAKESGIPIVQNIPLAHAIFDNTQIDQEISPDLYMAVAEVLAYVYKLRGNSGQKKNG